MRALHRLPLSLLVLAALAGCETPHPEQDPAFIKATAVEGRVDRLEQQAAAILDLQRSLDASQGEVRILKGQAEELRHTLQQNDRKSQDRYQDLYDRLGALEKKVRELEAAQAAQAAAVQSAAPAAPAVAPPPAATPVAAVSDRDVYQAALERLKAKDYGPAEKALQDFIGAYPQSSLLENAQFWLGEAYFEQRRFGDALVTLQKLVKDHPDSRKLPDALLTIGNCQQEQKRYHEARDTLAHLVKAFPDAPASAEARQRLKQLAAGHH